MKQKWKPMQFVEISMHEIFAFQDKLDAVQDNPEKVWDVVDDFFMECENQLELSPGFIKELHDYDLEKDFVPLSLSDIDDLFDDDDFSHSYITASDYVNYVLYLRDKNEQECLDNNHLDTKKGIKKFREDIPFTPRHDF